MTATDSLSITFWGVRGSIPAPGPQTARYGGNTSCMEILAGGHRIVIDGGSGLRELGLSLLKDKPEAVDIFFTHTHWDHVCGIPFFVPAYLPGCAVRFWAAHMGPEGCIRNVLCDQMMAPLFPVPIGIFQQCSYNDFRCGTMIEYRPGLEVSTCPLNHPNGACGYRIDFAGHAICVITDTEHKVGAIDQTIVDFCKDADMMIYDAMYREEDFDKYVGWGHSTWQEALRVGDAAGVGKVILFHHDPVHDDDRMDEIAQAAAGRRPGTVVAREGLTLTA